MGLLFLLGVSTATPASASDGFRTYPTCHILDFRGQHPPAPSHSCHVGDDWGTVFIARHERNVHYRICVKPPGKSRYCARRRTFGHSQPDGWYGAYTETGTYRFTWHVHKLGVVDRDRLTLLP